MSNIWMYSSFNEVWHAAEKEIERYRHLLKEDPCEQAISETEIRD